METLCALRLLQSGETLMGESAELQKERSRGPAIPFEDRHKLAVKFVFHVGGDDLLGEAKPAVPR